MRLQDKNEKLLLMLTLLKCAGKKYWLIVTEVGAPTFFMKSLLFVAKKNLSSLIPFLEFAK